MFDLKCSLRKNVFYYIINVIPILVQSYSIESGTHIPDNVKSILHDTNIGEIKSILNQSNFDGNDHRRILMGYEVKAERPYMVYLRLPVTHSKYQAARVWLCAGVIIHDEYILTSAACIEDAKHFYVVAGTNIFDPEQDKHSSLCIKNGARKAVWKCVPNNYSFQDHQDDNNLRWLTNDIAVVQVDEEWNFDQRVRGCDYIPKPIRYNNQSEKYEKPGIRTTIAGWGSTERYSAWLNKRRGATLPYTKMLLETSVEIITKTRCKAFWGAHFAYIIDTYMICSSDNSPHMSEICDERYVDCVQMEYPNDEIESMKGRKSGEGLKLFSYLNNTDARKATTGVDGGFCENDHGGPMVYGEGPTAMVIGVISACLVKERTNKCKGPFLYTSVFKHKKLLDCAIYKDILHDCARTFRTKDAIKETYISWIDHPDGPAKKEIGPKSKSAYRKIFSSEPSNIGETTTIHTTNKNIITSTTNSNKSSETSSKTLELATSPTTIQNKINVTIHNGKGSPSLRELPTTLSTNKINITSTTIVGNITQ